MARNTKIARQSSILKGALAGLIGGIVGSAAKSLAEKVYPPGPTTPATLPALLTEPEHPLPKLEKKLAEHGLRWTYGAVAGAVYGAAVELEPKAGAWRGAAFGLALNKFSKTPTNGFPTSPAPSIRQTTRQRQSQWVTYAVYGVVTDSVRRLFRNTL